ncbi:MAG: UvrD-helicase domain-containing protein, partial [Lachnospiraceae bacterium]|nr:UvrD-helicase domain-containing protein [Lachnospiraceae bacterium]
MADNMKWTSEQRSVIDSRDQSLLVSAAAGSGKTAVLVQRILDQILDPVHPVEIDRMLIVTFTNAAAAQLRQKIRDRLEDAQEEAAAEGDEKKLDLAARQLALLADDHIETIDRFCREVVLDHATIVGVDPAFRIGDDGEMKLLRSDAVAEAIENAYASEDTAFVQDLAEFSDLYAPGRMDNKLEDLILRFYMFSQSHAFPRIWRRECAELYRGSAQGSLWMESFLDSVRTTVRELRELVEDALEVCRQSGGPYQYTAALESDSALLSSLEDCRSPEEFHALLNGMTWAKLGREKKNGPYVEPSKAQYVQAVRKKIKESVNKQICPL